MAEASPHVMRIIRSPVFLRLADQGSWSLAFFLFTLLAGAALGTEDFAALTVATSIGVIGAACIRAFAIDGRIVAGAHQGASASASLSFAWLLRSSATGAPIAMAVTYVWLIVGGHEDALPEVLLTGLIVVADGPHYLLVMRRRYRLALIPAATYTLGAVVLAANVLTGRSSIVLVVWCVTLCVSAVLSWLLARGIEDRLMIGLGVPLRLSAEAFYSALGSQLGLLTIFLVSSAAATVGFRLSYSVVFAPVFSIIQGLTPLLLGSMSDLQSKGSSTQVALIRRWALGGSIGIIGSGLVGAFVSGALVPTGNFSHVVDFVAPVGAGMLGSFILDSALLFIRFRAHSRIPHRIRLALLGMDIALQLGLTLTAHVPGLVVALLVGAAVKIIVAVIFSIRVSRGAEVIL
jgi:hypothetical protein